jgi:TonB family protein
MSYQALLFCPDEKTARVVSQVLSELEFTVEPCHEPFAAVKKLMAQHFDAIVVDCDNEQNAALLFKSARNSGSNQASLAVAVVEGQTGVAKAFRLGANLVLTKPIHVEQSKGTLRVARGLLRKGQTGKPAATSPALNLTQATLPQQFMPAPVPQMPMMAPPTASAAAFELDADPSPQPDLVDAALLEYMPDSPTSGAEIGLDAASESDSSKQYPWQPRKPLAEPMASAMRKAAEAAGKSELDAAAARSAAGPQAGVSQTGVSQTGASQTRSVHPGIAQTSGGAAAAPARAREIPSSSAKTLGLEPTASAIAVPAKEEIAEVKKIEDPSASDGWNSRPAPREVEASFSTLEGDAQAANAGGSKKTLVIAAVVAGLAIAGYFGWSSMQASHSQTAPQQSAAPETTGTGTLPPQPTAAVPEASGVQGAGASHNSDMVSPSKPSAAVIAEGSSAQAAGKSGFESDATQVKAPAANKGEAGKTLLVQNGSSLQAKAEPAAQEAEVAPEASSIATGSGSSALSGLVNTNAINAQKAAPQETLRISQGVSEGMILKRVQPVYSQTARQMRLEGRVELQANISPSGSITGVKQLSGDQILGRSAIDAVKQWKYKPYYLNGTPIEIQTQITVNFKLP